MQTTKQTEGATYKSKFPEATTIGVLSKLKGANRIIDMLEERIDLNTKLIESMIEADFNNKSLHTLLLKTLQNCNRRKQVASWIEKGEMTGLEAAINPQTFRCTLMRCGKVRVCITPEFAKEIKEQYGHQEKFRIYE